MYLPIYLEIPISRMILHGQSLEISGIREEDTGEYICEVETYGAPLDQTHTLEVLGKEGCIKCCTGHLEIYLKNRLPVQETFKALTKITLKILCSIAGF